MLMYILHNTANLLPLKLRREIALTKIMFNQVQDNQGLQLRELSTRAHDGSVMEVLKPTSSKYMKSVAYRGPTSWNSLKPELRCLRVGFISLYYNHRYITCLFDCFVFFYSSSMYLGDLRSSSMYHQQCIL